MKVKIITLYSGESEYQDCIDSVARQRCKFEVVHDFIEHKPKPVAHNQLYRTIMDESDDYSFFVKLDADMVFASDSALQEVIDYAVASQANYFSIPVHDYLTDSMMWGLNVYGAGMAWNVGSESLFTDRQEVRGCVKRAKVSLSKRRSLVSHASAPTAFQAFSFGVHRAAKVCQFDASAPRLSDSYAQYKVLQQVMAAYRRERDSGRGYAIIGACMMLKQKLSRTSVYDRGDFQKDFDGVIFCKEISESLECLGSNWFSVVKQCMGVRKIGLGSVLYLKNKLWR